MTDLGLLTYPIRGKNHLTRNNKKSSFICTNRRETVYLRRKPKTTNIFIVFLP